MKRVNAGMFVCTVLLADHVAVLMPFPNDLIVRRCASGLCSLVLALLLLPFPAPAPGHRDLSGPSDLGSSAPDDI